MPIAQQALQLAPDTKARYWRTAKTDRDAGLANLATIAAIEAAPHGLSVPQCLDYLSDNLHYNLGYDEQQGLRRFHEYAMELGLAPSSGNFDAAFRYSKHFQTKNNLSKT